MFRMCRRKISTISSMLRLMPSWVFWQFSKMFALPFIMPHLFWNNGILMYFLCIEYLFKWRKLLLCNLMSYKILCKFDNLKVREMPWRLFNMQRKFTKSMLIMFSGKIIPFIRFHMYTLMSFSILSWLFLIQMCKLSWIMLKLQW